MRRAMPDPCATFKCLVDFDIYACDGHLHSLDLRSHGMTHLTVSDQVEPR
jgi:hypothetical protein